MKVPDIFRIEKNLDEKIKYLKDKKDKIEFDELIIRLRDDYPHLEDYFEFSDKDFVFTFADCIHVKKAVELDYIDSTHIEIYEFNDKRSLEIYSKDISKEAEKRKTDDTKGTVMLRNNVYISIKSKNNFDLFFNYYKNLGFEECRI